VDYAGSAAVRSGVPKTVRLIVTNTYKIAATLRVRWYAPDGWDVSPCADGLIHVKQAPFGNRTAVTFELRTERFRGECTRMVVELTRAGHPSVMLVPIMFTGGDCEPPAEGE
jgi:hypothetical protein